MFGIEKMGDDIKTMVDESFVGGTVYQASLSPWCYHRWHAPVAGTYFKAPIFSKNQLLISVNLVKTTM